MNVSIALDATSTLAAVLGGAAPPELLSELPSGRRRKVFSTFNFATRQVAGETWIGHRCLFHSDRHKESV